MKDTKPLEITLKEWKEILSLPNVRKYWNLDIDTSPEEFAGIVYGVKFNYTAVGYDYAGDLYLLQGADSYDMEPVTIIRINRELKIVVNKDTPRISTQ